MIAAAAVLFVLALMIYRSSGVIAGIIGGMSLGLLLITVYLETTGHL